MELIPHESKRLFGLCSQKSTDGWKSVEYRKVWLFRIYEYYQLYEMSIFQGKVGGGTIRVTLDYDGDGFVSKFRTIVAWFVLRAISRGNQYGRRSARSGVHLKAHGLKISFKMSLLIRIVLSEDRKRSWFDMKKSKKPKQCLWSEKDNKKAGEWSKSLWSILS